MPLDPVLITDTRAWLQRAANDLRAADLDLAATPPLIEDALFHCQQATEKALKAFLTYHDIAFRKTHNLEEIGAACLEVDQTLGSLIAEVTPLSEYAWLYRYPGSSEALTLDEANEAHSVAQRAYEAVLERLPPATYP